MPLLSFSVLKEKLLDGTKTQTIRMPRKIPLKVGDKLYIYWKCRTKETAKLGEGVITHIVSSCYQNMTDEDAQLDGFVDKQAFGWTFGELHKDADPYTPFDIITWKWTSGGPLTNSSKSITQEPTK